MQENIEDILVKYLQKYHNWDYIKIRQYEIQGAELNVQFYTDETEHNIESTQSIFGNCYYFYIKINKTLFYEYKTNRKILAVSARNCTKCANLSSSLPYSIRYCKCVWRKSNKLC